MIYFISTDEEEIKGRKILNFRGIFSISFFEELISFLRFSGGKTGKRATCAFDWLQSATDPLFFSFDARASPPPSRKNRREKEKGREREKNRKKKKERAFANKSSRDSNTNGKINLRKKNTRWPAYSYQDLFFIAGRRRSHDGENVAEVKPVDLIAESAVSREYNLRFTRN